MIIETDNLTIDQLIKLIKSDEREYIVSKDEVKRLIAEVEKYQKYYDRFQKFK